MTVNSGKLKSAPAEIASETEEFFQEQFQAPLELFASALSTGSSEFSLINSLEAFETFLTSYRDRVLIPIELDSITRAFFHTARGEARELGALDLNLAKNPFYDSFSSSSRSVGRLQLRRLRPLKDHRPLQKYIRAVDNGEAAGWHPLVYGIFLAVYSFPIREGLLHYCRQTISTLTQRAGKKLGLTEPEMFSLQRSQLSALATHIESRLQPALRIS